ncbi:spinocerebellar ataxia type 10 protein domain-containing protein [Scleroderma citrinum]
MNTTDENSINIRFCSLCERLLNGVDEEAIPALSQELDDIACDLARDEELRTTVGADQPTVWPGLRRLWRVLVEEATVHEDDELTRTIITSTCRFTRNLVAGVATNQQLAFENEPALRQIIHIYSSWSAAQDPGSFRVIRMAVQTLSNMVTANENLMTRLWETYMNLQEEQAIFVRVINSPDPRSNLYILVMLVNCIHESSVRQALLAKTRVGAKICITLLDCMTNLHDADEASDSGKAFDYGYHLFAHLFEGGFTPDLYGNLKVAGTIIVPHQTILLKLLDSYLQSSPCENVFSGMVPVLTTCFFEHATYCSSAIRSVVGSENMTGDNDGIGKSPDPILPKACEALVLVTQCIASIMLASESDNPDEASTSNSWQLFRDTVWSDGRVIAENAVELLRLLDIFLPRINFGKPVLQPGREEFQSSVATADPTGFSYLKRDLVRLLGILCHKDKKTQDCIRNCDGIPVIMSMCVIDERNPYLREHAIFTLHNLLEDNDDNQAVVHRVQPTIPMDEIRTPYER